MSGAARTLTIPAAAALLGVSRNTAYEEAKTGRLAGVPVLKVGRRLLIPAAPFYATLGVEIPPNGTTTNGSPS